MESSTLTLFYKERMKRHGESTYIIVSGVHTVKGPYSCMTLRRGDRQQMGKNRSQDELHSSRSGLLIKCSERS